MTDDLTPPPTVPPFSDEYHRARRNLTLTSALLLGWEFVGVEVGENPQVPIAGVPIHIRNPEVISLVLFLLVLFFVVRFLVEWYQTDETRRLSNPSKSDLYLATSVAFLSLALFAFQAISGVNVADKLSSEDETSFWFIIFLFPIGGMLISNTFQSEYDDEATEKTRKYIYILSVLTLIAIVIFMTLSGYKELAFSLSVILFMMGLLYSVLFKILVFIRILMY